MRIEKEVLEKLYWEEFLTIENISLKLNLGRTKIKNDMKYWSIPLRTPGYQFGDIRHLNPASGYWSSSRHVKEHREEAKNIIGRKLLDDEQVHHKDGNPLNNHPRNIEIVTRKTHQIKGRRAPVKGMRPSIFHLYMTMAHLISFRSTCSRLKVGAIITNYDLEQVYSIGYNGNASGLANNCDSDDEGACGCIHAEENALIKCSVRDKNKILFVTDSPCLKCSKLIINSGFSWVFYMRPYRKTLPLFTLHYKGIKTCPYPITIKSGSGGEVYLFADQITGNEIIDLSTLEKSG